MPAGPARRPGTGRPRPARVLRGWLQRTDHAGDVSARVFAAWDRRTGAGRARTWEGVANVLVGSAPTGIGVDVFDTVLTRRVVGDEAVFWMTGGILRAQGVWSGTGEAFVRARYAAAAAHPDGTLWDIYGDPVLADGCPPVAGTAAEVSVEQSLAIAVTGARSGLEHLRDAGHRVVFVSDMHLPRRHLLACLADHGLAEPGDHLVVSSEVGASKWSGTLFPLLRESKDTDVHWHVGNDLWSDVAMAERAGVRSMPVRLGEPTDLERVMAGRTGSVGAAIAGAARQARWGRGHAVEDALRETGADVAGQCLAAFLLWARQECAHADVRQVAFLARDGELPLRMARAMPADYWAGVDLQYLHGSRRLWSVAAAAVLGVPAWLQAGTAEEASFIRQGQHDIPLRSLLARIALNEQDLTGHPSLAGLPLDQPLPKERDQCWRSLLAQEGTQERIAQRAATQFAALREYLLDQGISDRRLALVDVGWRGELAWQVSAVLHSISGWHPVHLHFGGVDVAVQPAGHVDIRRFAVDDSIEALPFPDVVSCVETFTASGRPRARSLERDETGTVRLVFDDALPAMNTPQRHLLWQSAVDVARHLPSRSTLQQWGLTDSDLADPVRKVLSAFWLTPSAAHALAAAHLAAEVDDAGIQVRPVASPYRLGERAGSRTWRQGSLKLTNPVLRPVLSAALGARGRVKRTGQ